MSRVYRVMPHEESPLDALARFEGALAMLEPELGLSMRFAKQENAPEGLKRRIYLERDKRAVITLVEDTVTPARYAKIEAKTGAEAEAIADALAPTLEFRTLDDLKEAVLAARERDPGTLVRLALGSPERVDDEVLDLVIEAIESPAEDVRYAAATAAGITQWPEWVPELEPLLDDPSDDVRAVARKAIDSARHENGDGS